MPTTNTPARRSRLSGSILYYFVGLIVIILIGAWGTVLFGRVWGTEFSPETLQRRKFSYYQIPLLGIQVTPIDRAVVASATEQYLLTNKLVTQVTPEKWDLVDGYQGATLVDPRGASILCAYFDTLDFDNRPYWERWSVNNPQLAAILWPEVISIARLRQYEMVPDLMRLAQTSDNSQSTRFRTELDAMIVSNAVQLAEWWTSVDVARARDLYQLALSKDAGHQGARAALAKLPAPKKTKNK